MGNTITVPFSALQDPVAAPQPTAQPQAAAQGTISVPFSQLQDPIPFPGQQQGQAQPPADYLSKTEDVIDSGARGLVQAGEDVWDTVKNAVTHPVGTALGMSGITEHPLVGLVSAIKDTIPVLHAYEQARISGKGVMASLQAANEQASKQDAATQLVKQRAEDFKKNPTQATTRALGDAAAIAMATWAGGKVLGAFMPAAEGGIAAGTTEAAGAEEAAGELATQAAPKAQAVARGVSRAAKAGVSEGMAETVAPTGEGIQPHLHQGIRNFVNQAARDAGLEPVPDSVPVTDAPQKLADAFQVRSQATFDKVEEITGVNPTTLKEQMAARADQITEAVASGDLEKSVKLELLQQASEDRAIKAFNDAKAQGVDIEQARSDWNSSLRGDELSAAVRGSKANTSTLKSPVLDPNKLAPRLQKLAESQPGGKAPKLFQLGGEDNATDLVEHAENAREATQTIKDFVPQSATGQKLFSQIVANNTAEKSSLLRGGKPVGVTDWNGVVKDIGNLTPEQQAALGDDLGRMRQVAGRQAVKQNALGWITGTTTVGKMARGALAEELLRRTR